MHFNISSETLLFKSDTGSLLVVQDLSVSFYQSDDETYQADFVL